jgi:CMP-N-acetylneuraminic acid synthetase
VIRDKEVLAVITARAGSKGIPGKNYRDLLGKPLFLWSVEAALNSMLIDRIVISSNCEECFKAYDKWYRDDSPFVLTSGAYDTVDSSNMRLMWLQRPDKLSGDLSKNEDALIHAHKSELRFQVEADIVMNLQPTSPCRPNNLIDRCLEEYVSGDYNSLLTGTKDTPFLWQKKDGEWIYPVDKNDCCNRKMRQEFGEDEFTYHDNGNIYIVDKKVLLETECRIGDKPCVFETEGLENIQIDEEFDFELIEQIAKVKGLTTLI